MNTHVYTLAKGLFIIGFILIVLAGLLFCLAPNRAEIVKQLESRHLPTPQLADNNKLLSILTTEKVF